LESFPKTFASSSSLFFNFGQDLFGGSVQNLLLASTTAQAEFLLEISFQPSTFKTYCLLQVLRALKELFKSVLLFIFWTFGCRDIDFLVLHVPFETRKFIKRSTIYLQKFIFQELLIGFPSFLVHWKEDFKLFQILLSV